MPSPTAAPEALHLLIADAALPLQPGAPQPPWPELPHLQALAGRMRLLDTLALDEDSPATPFEVALARARGLPDAPGRTPWAAFETGTWGAPCAWLVPCHWQMGLDDVTVLRPTDLQLTEAESRTLLAAVAPLLETEGLSLRYERPHAWLAQGELLRDLACWSVARAVQRPVTREQLALAPTEAQSRTLRRLQAEWQMLLYTHPVNEAREQARRWPVNALWIAGAGALLAPPVARTRVQVETHLMDLPTDLDATTWASAWQAVDAEAVAPLLAAARSGTPARLTLCGPRRAVTLETPRGMAQKFMNKISPLRLSSLREQL